MLLESGGEVVRRPRDRLGQIAPERHLCRDRRREGATGPVDVGHGETGTGKDKRFPGDPGVVGDRVAVVKVPAFHQKIAAVAPVQPTWGEGERRSVADRFAEESFRFGEIRRDEGGEGEESRFHPFEPLVIEQGRSRAGPEDRIDHQRNPAVGREKIRHDLDEAAIRQHSGFRAMEGERRYNPIELRGQQGFFYGGNGADLARGFRHDGGDGIDPVDAVGGEGFEIGLYPRAAGGVGAGDGEGDGRGWAIGFDTGSGAGTDTTLPESGLECK